MVGEGPQASGDGLPLTQPHSEWGLQVQGPDSTVLSRGWGNIAFLQKKNNPSQTSHRSLKPLQTLRPQQLTREQLYGNNYAPSPWGKGGLDRSQPLFCTPLAFSSPSGQPSLHSQAHANPWFSTNSSCELKVREGPWDTRWGWLTKVGSGLLGAVQV